MPPVTTEDLTTDAGAAPPAAPASVATTPARPTGKGRGRKQSSLGRLRGEIPSSMRWVLIVIGVIVPFLIWLVAAAHDEQVDVGSDAHLDVERRLRDGAQRRAVERSVGQHATSR